MSIIINKSKNLDQIYQRIKEVLSDAEMMIETLQGRLCPQDEGNIRAFCFDAGKGKRSNNRNIKKQDLIILPFKSGF